MGRSIEHDAQPLMLDDVRGYVEYLRDLGITSFYQREGAAHELAERLVRESRKESAVQATSALSHVSPVASGDAPVGAAGVPQVPVRPSKPMALPSRPEEVSVPVAGGSPAAEAAMSPPKPVAFDALRPLPEVRIADAAKPKALELLRETIGDCTRCPLAYAGRHTIVFGEGSPSASLMFVGEGPGADEDASGRPFVGKAGQLLNNMIGAMGLRRDDVYIANVVKCRPPQNRVPEPIEANTCAPFLLEQIDTVQPKVIVALGATAATYLLGVRQSLSSLRERWHSCRGAKVVVTFHPAYLLRDPRQKGEAWKDLQRVMAELGLKAPGRS